MGVNGNSKFMIKHMMQIKTEYIVFIKKIPAHLVRLQTVRRPSEITSHSTEKSESGSTSSAVVLAASLPLRTAAEQSALRIARRSFTPSHIIVTLCPHACSAATISRLVSGVALPNIEQVWAVSFSCDADRVLTSVNRSAPLTPHCFAAAAAAQWGFPAWVAYGDLALLRAEARAGCGAVVGLQSSPEQIAAGAPERRFAAVRGFAAIDGSPKVLLCDPWASGNDFDCETDMPLDDFMVAWDNLALLMRQRKNNTSPLGRTRCSVWLRPVGTDAPGVYHMYINGEEHLLVDDFCARGGVLAYSLPDAQPHATTAHRQFTYVEPTQGGILLERGDTPRKYTVYAIDSAGGMLVGDVTVSAQTTLPGSAPAQPNPPRSAAAPAQSPQPQKHFNTLSAAEYRALNKLTAPVPARTLPGTSGVMELNSVRAPFNAPSTPQFAAPAPHTAQEELLDILPDLPEQQPKAEPAVTTASAQQPAPAQLENIESPELPEEEKSATGLSALPIAHNDPTAQADIPPEQTTFAPAPASLPLRVVGEVFKTYIITERNNELCLIDKHAAHERILFEQLAKDYGSVPSQMLLVPVQVNLSAEEKQALLAHQELLQNSGVEVDDYGGFTVVVRAVPADVPVDDVGDMVLELANHLLNGGRDALREKTEWVLHSIACRAAIKAGDRTTTDEMLALAQKIMDGSVPPFCPHGRPCVLKLTRKELEKQFGRLV